jgi:hypothetical protein
MGQGVRERSAARVTGPDGQRKLEIARLKRDVIKLKDERDTLKKHALLPEQSP